MRKPDSKKSHSRSRHVWRVVVLVSVAACTRRGDATREAGRDTSFVTPTPALGVGPSESAAKFFGALLRGEGVTENPCVARDTIRCGSLVVVSAFSVDSSILSTRDGARVIARFTEIGSLVPTSGALRYVSTRDSAARVVTDTVKLVRELGSWHVIPPAGKYRVGAWVAMYYFDLADHGRDSIAADAGLDVSSAVRPVLTAPAELAQLRPAVRDTLIARGCRVLQRRGHFTDNVLRGAFYEKGADDWAVLCARGADAVILVFSRRGGAPVQLENVGGPIPDVNALPRFDDPSFIYGCAPSIGLASADPAKALVLPREIISDDDVGTDTLPMRERRVFPPRDGIESADCEGASNVYYWTGKRWARFAGAD